VPIHRHNRHPRRPNRRERHKSDWLAACTSYRARLRRRMPLQVKGTGTEGGYGCLKARREINKTGPRHRLSFTTRQASSAFRAPTLRSGADLQNPPARSPSAFRPENSLRISARPAQAPHSFTIPLFTASHLHFSRRTQARKRRWEHQRPGETFTNRGSAHRSVEPTGSRSFMNASSAD
jgi:hypothetical protein